MIPITTLAFTIEMAHEIDLGANVGSTLRGALYETLTAMYDTGVEAQSRHDLDSNPVSWLMRLKDDEVGGGHEPARPIAIRPTLTRGERQAVFGISFIGRGREAIPLVLSAVEGMGGIGMGRNRRRFRLLRVESVDPISHQPTLLWEEGQAAFAALPEPPGADAYTRFAALLDAQRLEVEFLTPTRIVAEERLCKQPVFRHWVQRLLERVRRVSELYSEPVWIPFRELLPLVAGVTLMKDETRWQEMWSYSRRDGTDKPTSGFVGNASYEGELAPLLPYLILGQTLQIGKNVVKGCGWYQLQYRWRS
jgi:hypothetical protein